MARSAPRMRSISSRATLASCCGSRMVAAAVRGGALVDPEFGTGLPAPLLPAVEDRQPEREPGLPVGFVGLAQRSHRSCPDAEHLVLDERRVHLPEAPFGLVGDLDAALR